MTKQEKFLYIVQMSTFANCINLSTQPEIIDKYRHVISLTGVFNIAQDALRVSEDIPEHMTAAEAANEFITYSFDNQKDNEEHEVKCPEWCLIRG